jgi:hypothetical protein
MDMILGILLDESYSDIRALADLSVCILIIPTMVVLSRGANLFAY